MNRIILTFICVVTCCSCQVKPKEIRFGEQACHFCRMTIVDKQHAAQIVTKKGKIFNFDAAECMINYSKGIDTETVGLFLVTDFNNPEVLIDAKTASFIISEDIPSPMGANLSAVRTKAESEVLLMNRTGTQYNWEALVNHLNAL